MIAPQTSCDSDLLSYKGLIKLYQIKEWIAIEKKKRKYNRKKSNYNGLKIIHSEDVFDGKIPKKGVKVVARVSNDMPYLTKFNPKTKNQSYYDSLDALPNNLKNQIVKEFVNKRKVLYLVDK